MGAKNITLYAQWTAKPVYTLTYLGNGNTGGTPPSDVSNEAGVTITVAGQETLVKKGHSFTGWNTEADGSGVSYAPNSPWKMGTINDTLYAQWEINRYTITYDGNGSDVKNVPLPTTHRYNTETNIATETPIRTGYTFYRWNTSQAGDGEDYNPGDKITISNKNVTLFARWKINYYPVIYSGNGKTGGTAPQTLEYAYDTLVTIQKRGNLVKSCSSFVSWNSAADGSGSVYHEDMVIRMPADTLRLYAQWSRNSYTVTFIKNDAAATGSMSPQTIACDETASLKPNGYTKTGWSFAGWATSDGGEVVYLDKANYPMGEKNDTLYAKWTINRYPVIYLGNGKTGGTAPQTVNYAYDTTVTIQKRGNLVKSCSSFVAWNSAADGSGNVYHEDMVIRMPADTLRLYAQWAINSYTVTFNKNDNAATGSMSPQTIACGETASLTPNAYTKTGWSFAGWAESAGGGVKYGDKADYLMGEGDDTLYAKWTINSYKVTFNTQGGSTVNSQTVPYSGHATAPASPTLSNCNFSYWYKEPQCFNKWDFNTDVIVSDTKLYAGYTVTDIDGNVYKTELIGNQRWMAENLRVKRYRDGTDIFRVTDNATWGALTTGGYCWYDNDSAKYNTTYGILYNWYAVTDSRQIAPVGWHVATDADWTELEAYLGGSSVAGGKLKEAGTAHWSSPNAGATNETGFSALPGGYRNYVGAFSNIGYVGYWWSVMEFDGSIAWYLYLYSSNAHLGRYYDNKSLGFSVRCLLGEKTHFNVTFNSQGGSTVQSQSVQKGSRATVPTPPTLRDCTFDGWYKEPQCFNKWDFGTDVIVSDTTLYAGYTVTDIDGNVYKTVLIGNQRWMAENLKTTKYNDRTPIPLVTDSTEWGNLTAPAYCWYDNNEALYKSTYGALYNWYTVNTGKLAPAGWHVPTDAEWDTLKNYLIANGYNWDGTKEGNKIAKSMAATTNWTRSSFEGAIGKNPATNNRSGFSAFPGGSRNFDGPFWGIDRIGLWWSATEFDASFAWSRALYFADPNLDRDNDPKRNGFSVRCVRD